MKNTLRIVVALLLFCQLALYAQSDIVNQYSVAWDSPSKNSSGAMPIGNGEVGANVWMEENGNLVFYLSRTDAWSENSSLYKLGKVRLAFYPALNSKQMKFKQFLNLEEGKIEFAIADRDKKIELEFLVDNESPVVYLQGKSTYPVQVTATSEVWRTQARLLPIEERHFALQKCPIDSLCMEYADVVKDVDNDVVVYHRNEHSIYPFTLEHQGLSEGDYSKDPFINRTMGYRMSGDRFVKVMPTVLSTGKMVNDFCLKIVTYTEQTASDNQWMDRTKQLLEKSPSFEEAARRTASWWKFYWDKSYIVVDTPDDSTGYKITQAYILQNWMNACGGRGNYPIKFNGSIFTVDPCYTDANRTYNPDYRLWGPDYWWQNTRLMYHPMLKSGDYEMMKVLFRHYFSNLAMFKRNAEVLWNTKGAVTPETSTIFGTFVNHDFGWDPNKKEVIDNPYVRYYWSSSLEIASLMADYYQYTLDQSFARDTLVPMANEVLTFYYSFFPRDKQGKLLITPTHSLETYWNDVRNDMPNVAGLYYLTEKLLQLPVTCATNENVSFWKEIKALLPELPTRQQENKTLFAPAETYEAGAKTNMENPELYVVFPFPLCHIGLKNCQQGIDSYNSRVIHYVHCWTQDGQQAARLGLTEEAKNNLLGKLQYANSNHRFPVIWGPNFDWSPDQDHGGNLLLTLQEMVMQAYGDKVYVLPAFPKEWDVSFKLYIPGENGISGKYKGGKWKQKPALWKKQNIYHVYNCDF
ncbi:DUF5703 domain-containing protein [Parabacteroides goldsteinii]|jgi:hypothetical protein|uniref:DUF5703 domain-containing protein n=1 Tax=Parabacteroides goldsteinii TaxID=328812 RepID=UPI0026745C21|nr:DUF5703 domain-containing protein [Parabacteroides goldsteinii]